MGETKEAIIERTAEKFTELPESEKSFVAGYVAGTEYQRSQQEKQIKEGA